MLFEKENEKLLINNALNEVLHGSCYSDVVLPCKEEMKNLLNLFNTSIDSFKNVVCDERNVHIINIAFTNVFRYMDEDEFETILGVTYEEAAALREKLNCYLESHP